MSAAGPPQGAKAPPGLRAGAPGLPAQAGTARRGAGSDGSAACKASEDTPVPSVGALVVLDTNIVLDAFVFSDAAALPLLSKDRAVLRMRKRLAALGVHAGIALAHQPA
jgi:hypothetical protein